MHMHKIDASTPTQLRLRPALLVRQRTCPYCAVSFFKQLVNEKKHVPNNKWSPLVAHVLLVAGKFVEP